AGGGAFDGGCDAAYADFLFAVVDGEALLADAGEFGGEGLGCGDGAVGGCGHAGAFDDGQGLFVGELGQEGFADAGGVGEVAAADFGEHAHGGGCGNLGDVDDCVSDEHGQVGGYAEFFDQVG